MTSIALESLELLSRLPVALIHGGLKLILTRSGLRYRLSGLTLYGDQMLACALDNKDAVAGICER